MGMVLEEWLRLRGRLNHDWLQNRYLTFLAARYRDPQTQDWSRSDLRGRLLEWREKEPELLRLLKSTEEALSPRQLLAEPPLANLPQADKDWLAPLVHELYCARTDIRQRVAGAEAKVEVVDRLVSAISGEGGGDASELERLYAACRELSHAISELPSRIQIG